MTQWRFKHRKRKVRREAEAIPPHPHPCTPASTPPAANAGAQLTSHYASIVNNPRTRSAVTPRTSIRFIRLRSPLKILTAPREQFKTPARNSTNASFARSSNAGARNRTFNAPSISPAISSLRARGCTRTINTTARVSKLVSTSSTIRRCSGRLLRRSPFRSFRRRESHPPHHALSYCTGALIFTSSAFAARRGQ